MERRLVVHEANGIRAESVMFLGESHVVPFSDRVVFRDDAPPLITRAIFLGEVGLATVTTDSDVLAPSLRAGLVSANLLIRRSGPGSRGEQSIFSAQPRGYALRRAVYAIPPQIVVCLGGRDILDTMNRFPGDDFAVPVVPGMHPLPSRYDDVLPDALGVDFAAGWFTDHVKPLQHAFAALRNWGFSRLAFLAVTPPTDDDEYFRRLFLIGGAQPPEKRVRGAFRYKVALLLNALVAMACAAEGVTFLDSWPMLTEDGTARPEIFGPDSAHLNDATATDVLLQLVVPEVARSAERVRNTV